MIKKIVKRFLRSLPSGTKVPMFGSNWGKKWILDSANIRNWLALDEKGVQRAFKKYIQQGNVVYDVGANVGFYSLLSSSLVGPKGKVYAFEPAPRNLEYLKKHVEMNCLDNVEIVPLAVSDQDAVLSFDESDSSSTGHISDTGKIKVEAMSLDGFVEKRNAKFPNFVKIDVEGHEMGVLRGMMRILEDKNAPVIQIEANEERSDILEFLKSRGYEIERIDSENIVCFKAS
jgi:FkbM family methyltransferase